jgi:hypothetical protein
MIEKEQRKTMTSKSDKIYMNFRKEAMEMQR